jgi:hypothetical protein
MHMKKVSVAVKSGAVMRLRPVKVGAGLRLA